MNVTAVGDGLQKTGSTAAWDAGAISQQTLPSGDGAVQVTADVTSTKKMFGLNSVDTNQSYTEVLGFPAPGINALAGLRAYFK